MCVYRAVFQDKRYIPPKETIIEFLTEEATLEYLENHDNWIYRNILHHFDCPMKPKKIKSIMSLQDNPTEKLRKTFPRGSGDWPGSGYVWNKLQEAACYLALNKQTYLSDDHIEIMAVMGTGNEELMKDKLLLAREYRWVK